MSVVDSFVLPSFTLVLACLGAFVANLCVHISAGLGIGVVLLFVIDVVVGVHEHVYYYFLACIYIFVMCVHVGSLYILACWSAPHCL